MKGSPVRVRASALRSARLASLRVRVQRVTWTDVARGSHPSSFARTQPEGLRRTAMGLPLNPRRGQEVHRKAVGQLDDALERQRDLVDRAEAAEGTSGEQRAADALGTVRHQVAA